MEWLTSNAVLILGVLLGMSESLALIPSVKANGIVDAIINVLKFVKNAVTK